MLHSWSICIILHKNGIGGLVFTIPSVWQLSIWGLWHFLKFSDPQNSSLWHHISSFLPSEQFCHVLQTNHHKNSCGGQIFMISSVWESTTHCVEIFNFWNTQLLKKSNFEKSNFWKWSNFGDHFLRCSPIFTLFCWWADLKIGPLAEHLFHHRLLPPTTLACRN